MIFDIYLHYEDADYRDVVLDMALEDYAGESWRAQLTLDKSQLGVPAQLGDIERCVGNDDTYEPADRNEIPGWVKNLTTFLRPRMEAVMAGEPEVSSFMDEAA